MTRLAFSTRFLEGARFIVGACALFFVTSARADSRVASFDFHVGGIQLGTARTVQGGDPERTLAVATTDITPALVSELKNFYEEKAAQKSLVLVSGAVVKRATEARLASVKLPSVGIGAIPPGEIELAFDVGSVRTSPSLTAVADKRTATGPKIAGFHLRVSELSATVNRLEGFTVKQIVGSSTLPPVSFVIDSADAPAFQAWAKSRIRRDTTIEYTDDRGAALLRVVLQGCAPTLTPNGPVTQVVVSCSRIRPS